jgi:hypothetical protein
MSKLSLSNHAIERPRYILATPWDAATWPIAKHELRRALGLRRRLARSVWWN